jgi:hypothetical protein
MAPAHNKLTIFPWLDAPLYNRIRYPQWKIYLYNAAQKMCTSLDATGAYCLVARNDDWNAHPKNIIPARPATPGGTPQQLAAIRARPVIAMPAFYARAATVYEREAWKLEKENFEKFDEAETIVHAAIVESLSQGTIRTINTQHIAGISSLTALQLVEVIHNLYNTPTLQDITTVENDLKRPLAHFEDFLDHVTDHLNNHESLRSFNQPASNITKIQTFKESIRRWPQFDTLIATWEINNSNVVTRQFSDFTDYLCNQYGNLPTDVKPRGGNAYNVRQAGRGRGRPKGKGKGKGKGKDDRGKGKPDKGKGRGLGRFVYWDEQDIPANKRLRPDHQVSSAVHDLVDEAAEQEDDAVSIHSRTSARSSASAAHQVHGSHTSSPLTSSAQNPNPKLYFYCNYHGWNLTHAGPDCRVMLNDTSYDRSHLQAKSPNDTTPRGNDQIEPISTDGRKRPFLKAWRAYSH